MKKIINKISSDELTTEATELLKVAFASNNISQKYKLFHEANDLKKIAKILWKYEEMTTKGDY